MLSGILTGQDSHRTCGHLRDDCNRMQVNYYGGDGWCDYLRTQSALQTDRASDGGVRFLLPYAGFMLGPDFNRTSCNDVKGRDASQTFEVFTLCSQPL